MEAKIRPEISEKNPYWIERHRYYELKHFCLQYHVWRREYFAIDGFSPKPASMAIAATNVLGNPTANCAMEKSYYSERMGMIERAAKETDEQLADYILKGVTEGWSYDILKARLEIPCGKDTYYDLYRRFFWLLDKERR